MDYKKLAKRIDNYIDSFTKKILKEWKETYDKQEDKERS